MRYIATEEHVKLLGRTWLKDEVCYLGYSCSGIEFEMTGTKAEALLWSDGKKWDENLRAWMAVFINDETTPSKRFCLNDEEGCYLLYQSEKPEKVKIKLIKYSEAAFAKVGIKELVIEGSEIVPTPDKDLKIEFIGDSITCGYGNEGVLGKDTFTTAQENPYLAYASQTALALNADYHLISWSGIGILSSYTEEDEPNRREQLMPKLYPYTNRALGEMMGEMELWDFNRFEPDYVVINLGTNDFSYAKEIKARQMAFEAVYYNFLLLVRMYRPKAHIICTLGPMELGLFPMVEAATQSFIENEKDDNIETFSFEKHTEADGIGTDSHPSLFTHQKMKRALVQKIQECIKAKNK